MNCPHCQQLVPMDHPAASCPFCGKELSLENPPMAPLAQPLRANWPLFFAVLFAPPVCCFIALSLDVGFLAVLFGALGSLISGVVCTRIVMRNFGSIRWRRALLQIIIGVLLCGISFSLSFLGCTTASSITHHGI